MSVGGNGIMSTSLPGLLGNYWNTKHMWLVTAESSLFERDTCREAYLIPSGLSEGSHVRRATEVAYLLAERLNQARHEYPTVDTFDLSDYLGFSESQRSACRHTRYNKTVFLRIFPDLFVPAFREAESYWANTFFRAYHNAYPSPTLIAKWNQYAHGNLSLVEIDGKRHLMTKEESIACDEWEERLLRTIGPEMRGRLQRAQAVLGQVIAAMEDQRVESFLRIHAAQNERRVQSVRRDLQVSVEDLFSSFDDCCDPVLLSRLSTCPTLTMEAVFEVE